MAKQLSRQKLLEAMGFRLESSVKEEDVNLLADELAKIMKSADLAHYNGRQNPIEGIVVLQSKVNGVNYYHLYKLYSPVRKETPEPTRTI